MPIRKRMNFGTSKKSALGRAALTKQVIQIDDALPSNDDSYLPAAKRLHHNVLATALANKLGAHRLDGVGAAAQLRSSRHGFSEGQNLTIEIVRLDQDPQKLFAATADLVRSNVDLLVATGPCDCTAGRHGGEPNHSDRHVGHQLRSHRTQAM